MYLYTLQYITNKIMNIQNRINPHACSCKGTTYRLLIPRAVSIHPATTEVITMHSAPDTLYGLVIQMLHANKSYIHYQTNVTSHDLFIEMLFNCISEVSGTIHLMLQMENLNFIYLNRSLLIILLLFFLLCL